MPEIQPAQSTLNGSAPPEPDPSPRGGIRVELATLIAAGVTLVALAGWAYTEHSVRPTTDEMRRAFGDHERHPHADAAEGIRANREAVHQQTVRLTEIAADVDAIRDDVSEIKADLRELLKRRGAR